MTSSTCLKLEEIHHDVIDDDPVLYTVFRLEEMKVEHEKIHTGGKEPSDEIVVIFFLFLLCQYN